MHAYIEVCFRNDFGELYSVDTVGETEAPTLDELLEKVGTMTHGRYHDFHVCRRCACDSELTLLSEGVRTISLDYEADEITTSFLRVKVSGQSKGDLVQPTLDAEDCPIRANRGAAVVGTADVAGC